MAEYELPRCIDITCSENFQNILLNLIKNSDSIKILANNVEKVDTSALQMIYLCMVQAETEHLPFSIDSPSNAFQTACKISGFKELLNI